MYEAFLCVSVFKVVGEQVKWVFSLNSPNDHIRSVRHSSLVDRRRNTMIGHSTNHHILHIRTELYSHTAIHSRHHNRNL